MRRHVVVPLVVLLVSVLTGCGDEEAAEPTQTPTVEQEEGTDMVQGDAGVQVTGEPGAKPVIEVPDTPPPDRLHYVDLIEGDGEVAPEGANPSMHYVGVAWSTGEQFDASWDSGATLKFPLSDLILGWQQGVPGMRVGGRRLLVVPPELGYGAQGVGTIGPNETLVFVIDLIELR